jgi:hypothetical protein
MAIRAARGTLATPLTYRMIGPYRAIGQVSAKFIPNSLEGNRRPSGRIPIFLQVRAL